MPGTSWARALADGRIEGAKTANSMRAIRRIMEILDLGIANHINVRRAGAGRENHIETSFAR
jgi:hypothetical protein